MNDLLIEEQILLNFKLTEEYKDKIRKVLPLYGWPPESLKRLIFNVNDKTNSVYFYDSETKYPGSIQIQILVEMECD